MRRRLLWFLPLILLAWPAIAVRGQGPQTRAVEMPVERGEVSGFSTTTGVLRLSEVNGRLLTEPYSPGWPFIAVGAVWDEALPEGAIPSLEIRVSPDGEQWGPWQPLTVAEDGADQTAGRYTDLFFVDGRTVQVRAGLLNLTGETVDWKGLRLALLDSSEGPTAPPVARARGGDQPPPVISRAAWGADESYRFDGQGHEIWPRDYETARAIFVHHTATSPTSDPAVAMRSIYYYHAVTLGWGDIGYHYVVDQFGNIYEGRYGTEQGGQLVVAGHALGYNLGTLGISMIGNYQDGSPPTGAVQGLQEMVAWQAARYGIDPFASVWLTAQGAHPDRWFDDALMGHRDSHNPARTSCPGDFLYSQLPAIRSYVASRIPALSDVTVQLAFPAPNETLTGIRTWQANGSPNVERMEFFLDDAFIDAATAPPWAIQVDSRSLPAGARTLRVRAISAVGTYSDDERPVIVGEVGTASSRDLFGSLRQARRFFFPTFFGAAAPLCTTHVTNRGFEVNTEWRPLLGDYAARYAIDEPYAGTRSLRAGMKVGDNRWGWSSARLPITLPAEAERAELTLAYLRRSDGTIPDQDVQYIGILNADEVYIESVIPSGRVNDAAWRTIAYDLTPHLGETIFVYVGVKNDGVGNSTRIYVDEVQVTSCQ